MKNNKSTHIFTAIIAIILTTLFVLSGCSKYQVEKPELTPEKIADYEKQIEDASTKLGNKDITIEEKVIAMESQGVGYERLGEYDKAIEIYKAILEIASSNFIALNNLTAIYEEVGEIEQAREYVGILHDIYRNDPKTNQEVVSDTIRILVKNKEIDTAQNVLEEYARNFQSTETSPFITEQYEYISRMRDAEIVK
jgi:tetratricopeptide (TPR) repeat protein